jgi:hypothetical protein
VSFTFKYTFFFISGLEKTNVDVDLLQTFVFSELQIDSLKSRVQSLSFSVTSCGSVSGILKLSFKKWQSTYLSLLPMPSVKLT